MKYRTCLTEEVLILLSYFSQYLIDYRYPVLSVNSATINITSGCIQISIFFNWSSHIVKSYHWSVCWLSPVLYCHTSLHSRSNNRLQVPQLCRPKQSSVFVLRKERGQNNSSLSACRTSASLSNGLHCLLSPLKSLQSGSTEQTINAHRRALTRANTDASRVLIWAWTHTHKNIHTHFTLYTTQTGTFWPAS